MKTYRLTTAGLLGLAGILLSACNEPARQPATAGSPNQPTSGVPGTPSGPRPSDEALNAPAQTAPVPLNPTVAAANDSTTSVPQRPVPFVERPGMKRPLDKKYVSPAAAIH